MARPTKIDYSKAVADYQTGQYQIPELARKYGIKRTTLITHLERKGIEVCDNLKEAVETLDKGLGILVQEKQKAISDTLSPQEQEKAQMVIESGIEYLERKHGVLARMAVNIVGKAMSKTDVLMSECANGEEFKNIMQGFKTAVDTIGLFPKQTIANQINIQNNTAIQNKQEINQKKLQIEFVGIEKK